VSDPGSAAIEPGPAAIDPERAPIDPEPAPNGTRHVQSDPGWTAQGPPDAPPVVLVHGSRLTRAAWAAVSRRLARAHRVITVDLPGHGSQSAVPFTLAEAADAVQRAIDQAAGGRAVVVGHSLGGYVAMDLAARSPASVRGLVVSGASLEPGGAWAPAVRAFAWFLGSRFVGGLDWLNDRYFRARFPPEVAEPLVAARYWGRGGSAGLRAIVTEQFAPRLARYPGPTLILNGELDVILRLGERDFLRAARSGRRQLIPRATHLALLDSPHEFAAAVAAFARSLGR
jgi:pimeloyl-ACP methyl ester carboxylesterase